MAKEIDPQKTSRAAAFAIWMQAPNPMVTLMKTLDVSNLIRVSRRRHLKFNMLRCFCIGKAAAQIREFYLLPVRQTLMQYDSLAVSVIVPNKQGGLCSCDILFRNDLRAFHRDYMKYTRLAAERCQEHDLSAESMVIGTSAVTETDLDGAVGMNSGIYNNPFMIWGRYRKGLLRCTLPVSFQFHHTQMDGGHAGRFLELLQCEINRIR